MLFWSISESQISNFFATLVKIWVWNKPVKLGYSEWNKTVILRYSEPFQKMKFQHFLQPWWRYDYEIKRKIRLFLSVSESQISEISSSMVEVWLWNETVKLGYS